jgi:acyl dehydratase
MRQFADLAEFASHAGEVLGESDWFTMTQATIDTFAEATGDFQYIHVDPVRAAQGPFGVPIAHGFLTLSLIPRLSATIYRIGGIATGINYGSNRVRFIEPVRVESRIRCRVKLLSAEPHPPGMRITTEATVQIEGVERPACVAEIIVLSIPA